MKEKKKSYLFSLKKKNKIVSKQSDHDVKTERTSVCLGILFFEILSQVVKTKCQLSVRILYIQNDISKIGMENHRIVLVITINITPKLVFWINIVQKQLHIIQHLTI